MKFTFSPESRPLAGFTLKRAIYRGGFGEVYFGVSDAGREVALKLLQHNTDIELRGIQQCLNLSHPNLVTIFDIREDADGDHWVVMEYIAGETLESILQQHPRGMPVEQVRQWLTGLAAGLSYLHQRGLVHRDLKPANLFIQDEVVKIGDVGLSKLISPLPRSAQTQNVGTVYYMAPEVARGQYTPAVDVYALGVILFEMLTGHLPFDGESTGEILMKHLTDQPDLSKLPVRIRPVMARALEKDPQQRYSRVTDLLRDFEAALVGRPTPPLSPQSGSRKSFDPLTALQRWKCARSRPADSPFTKQPRLRSKVGAVSPALPLRHPVRRRALGQLLAAAALSVPFVAILSAVLAGLRPSLFSAPGAESIDPALCGFFVAVAILACWGLLLSSALHARSCRKKHFPAEFACAGLLVGTAAWKLHQFLMIELPLLGDIQNRAIVHALGERPLSSLISGPTCLGYLVFFTAFFTIRKWRGMTSPAREQQFSIGAVIMTVLTAWITTRVFDFPTAWALAWGAVIACSLQLASVWNPPARRHAIDHSHVDSLI